MFRRLFSRLREQYRVEVEAYRELRCRSAVGTARTGQEPSAEAGYSSEPGRIQPESRGMFCKVCGGRDLAAVSNTHTRCSTCGSWFRTEPADADLRPTTEREFGVTYAGFASPGVPGIIERDGFAGEEISRRAATKEDYATPKPVEGKLR